MQRLDLLVIGPIVPSFLSANDRREKRALEPGLSTKAPAKG